MNKVFATTLVCLLISSVGCNSQPQSAPRPPLSKEQKLAEAVWRANGGTSWGNVARLQFTFRVDQEGQRLLSAKHDWDLEKNTDTVT
ncbi:MAG: hypothetical protein ACREIT_07900, partial [Tepidisphaeraceae bacterium]